ncbi:MAG: flagellar hook-associated protein FlgK [Sphingomonas bacterium]|nr:flagellar hook-associated protein FlgK [Sphingomonas bacterium]
MSDLLSIAASGVRAYQTALNTVGDNIANSGVAGYSRRSVTLNEVTVGGGPTVSGLESGIGVLASSIARSSNSFATQAMRSAGTDLSKTTTSVAWLDRIGKALDGNNIAARVTGFFNSSDALAAEPASSALRANFLAAGENVGNAFKATGIAFDQIDSDLDGQATQTAQTLTSLGASLVRINDGLGRTKAGTTAAAQLLDQRDVILDQMSTISEIKVTSDTIGRTSVQLSSGAGVPFVSIGQSNAVRYVRDNAGDVSFQVQEGAGWAKLDPTGGALAGFVEGAQRASAARDAIEAVATKFTTDINTQNRAGYDLNGNAGGDLFMTGTRPTDISIPTSVTFKDIAAAAEDLPGNPGKSRGTRDGGNLAQFNALRLTGLYESNVTSIVTANAAQLKQRSTIAEAQTAIRAGAETAVSTASGVNLDEEAIDLMRFQQAYQASSRAIQVARDTLQTILDIR